jgi:DNA-binding MarR family transcriptional regulator
MAGNSVEQDAPWLSHEQLREWVSLMALLMTVPASLDAQLKQDAGLNLFEYHILVELAAAPGRTRVLSELAAQTRGSLSRLSHAVSRLEASGWVERRSCGGAGRRTEAILTAAGWRKLQETAPGHVREARRLVIDALTAQQLEDLGEAARRIVAVANPEIGATLTEDDASCAEAS